MPNRIIKESICYSNDVNTLTPEQEVFFYRLIVHCDDYGLFDTRLLKSRLYPIKEDISNIIIEGYLQKLCSIGMIQLYENNNIRYLQLINWVKHQQVRATKSKFPKPDSVGSNLISYDIGNQLKSDDISGNHLQANVTVIQSNPILIQSTTTAEKNVVVENVFDFYQKNIGTISSFQAETIIGYQNDGLTDELIIEAIKDSLGVDNKWKYLNTILKNSFENKVFTLEEYNAKKVEKQNSNKKDTKPTEPQTKNAAYEVAKIDDDPAYELMRKANGWG